MAIDDLPSKRALDQLDMEDLGKTPLARLPAAAFKVLQTFLSCDPTQVADLVTEYQDTLETHRSMFLLRHVVNDLKVLMDKVEKLTEQQNAYLRTDWLKLYLDADKKARATRAEARIKRLADILCASIVLAPIPPADQTEEMMRIATELTDEDVIVLKELRAAYERYEHRPEQAPAPYNLLIPEVRGITSDAVLGICGKLQSLGLIATAQQRATALKQLHYPPGGGFALLSRAEAFLKFVTRG